MNKTGGKKGLNRELMVRKSSCECAVDPVTYVHTSHEGDVHQDQVRPRGICGTRGKNEAGYLAVTPFP